ncbi:MAG: VanW family protein [Candidatus Woesebacteria bacterium GW2011_GWB1_43_14]|uniref:VanW family protein n=1 Tax=Candidatus Woesebacteria bacterium GW2011_GWB1_43_14 TaxID=1618578 RepID=A0A0G1DIQ5_9BACT|nr:MAG: VanW family protein [Candidatus Woesebacteria bacterium GW2011_GWC1_42_9]KKS97477.1 MAG: VanW family protein [Candidatus Woesebacteria bacterium GW2011_GWB1_43_14]
MVIIAVLLCLLVLSGSASIILAFYHAKIYPNIFISDKSFGGLGQEEAKNIYREKFAVPEKINIEVATQKEKLNFELETNTFKASFNADKDVYDAYLYGREGNIFYDLKNLVELIAKRQNRQLSLEYDNGELENQISVIIGQANIEPIYPKISLSVSEIVISDGENGEKLNGEELKTNILNAILKRSQDKIIINTEIMSVALDSNQREVLIERAQKLKEKSLSFTFEFEEFHYSKDKLFLFLNPLDSYHLEVIKKESESIAEKLNRDPQNPTFTFLPTGEVGEGGRVQEFAPAKPGVKVKTEELTKLFTESIKELETTEETSLIKKIPVEESPPEFATEDVNNLGIKELIGRGTSTFRGSIASRVYNIGLASSRISGALVKPGEVFSFNATLGEVDKITGYKEAYIIQDGQTVLGDGGGVCQVSTTLFRAVLDAGLPVLERRAHSYRVGYYEQGWPVGFDATVYNPTTDFKFKNDTDSHILIQRIYNPNTSSLIFELYGTKDGRIATTTKPVITDVQAPPEDLYIDDPNLPSGQIKQIDYKAWGSKVSFYYEVSRGGEIIYSKTFYSNYQPWQAKFLRGTGATN